MKENKFNFYVDLLSDELEKSSSKTKEEGRYDNMILEGVASDSSKDADEEELLPEGFVLDRFLKEGLINYEHLSKSGGAKFIIGEPIDAKVKNGKFFIKGKLWKGKPIAEDLWDTLLIMKANNSTRKIGWSIEGKALERDVMNPKKVNKALLTHVALTFMPKNYNTYADIVKGGQSEDFIESEIETIGESNYVYTFMKGEKVYGVTKSFEIEEKEDEELEEKSDTGDSTSCLKKESLDKKIKKQVKAESLIKSLVNEKINIKQALFLAKKI